VAEAGPLDSAGCTGRYQPLVGCCRAFSKGREVMTYDTYSYKLYLKCSVNASEEDYALLKLDRLLDSIYEYLEDSGFELEDIEVQ
jgi:hypothetical protein